jgi:hypothetical protein
MSAPIQPDPVDLRPVAVTRLPRGRGLAGRVLTYTTVAVRLVVLGDERCLGRLADGADPGPVPGRGLSHV